jgi:hypothetical protein
MSRSICMSHRLIPSTKLPFADNPEGHAFTRAKNSRAEGASALPKARLSARTTPTPDPAKSCQPPKLCKSSPTVIHPITYQQKIVGIPVMVNLIQSKQ